jgi:hypothetical protein
MRISTISIVSFSVAVLGLAGCSTTGGGPVKIVPIAPAVDANVAVPCQEAAGDKYFMDPERVVAVSSSNQGGNTVVFMKADVRDAVCTLNAKGKVISLIDTTPKSADQIAAEEAKALAGDQPVVEKPVVKKKKK